MQILLQTKPLIRDSRGVVGDEFHKKIEIAAARLEVPPRRRPEKLKPPDLMPGAQGIDLLPMLFDERDHVENITKSGMGENRRHRSLGFANWR